MPARSARRTKIRLHVLQLLSEECDRAIGPAGGEERSCDRVVPLPVSEIIGVEHFINY
jgi:hypothetical protein